MEIDLKVIFHDAPMLNGATRTELLKLLPPHFDGSALYVVDATTFSNDERSVGVFGLWDHLGTDIRAALNNVNSISANVQIGNMGYQEFSNAVDADNVLRRFT